MLAISAGPECGKSGALELDCDASELRIDDAELRARRDELLEEEETALEDELFCEEEDLDDTRLDELEEASATVLVEEPVPVFTDPEPAMRSGLR